MPLAIPRKLVEFILLGPEDDRRQLQDSPILGDVWVAFASEPGKRLQLLITPFKEQAAGKVASELVRIIEEGEPEGFDPAEHADIAYLQGIIAANLTFREVLRCVVPMTAWWAEPRIAKAIGEYREKPEEKGNDIDKLLQSARMWLAGENNPRSMQDVSSHERYIALAGLLLWAEEEEKPADWDSASDKQRMLRIVENKELRTHIEEELESIFTELQQPKEQYQGSVWTISLNRRAVAAISKSVPAVKGDAARTLFRVSCKEIVWAVVDSGIDASHLAFRDPTGGTRIRRAFDFTAIRDLVSMDNRRPTKRKTTVEQLVKRGLLDITTEEVDANVKQLAEAARQGQPTNWELLEPLIRIDPNLHPPSNHGAHVAGILGAGPRPDSVKPEDEWHEGMCPDIGIYDFRVLGRTIEETEFAVIAALQYIRYINERNSYMTVHGANLSLSIPHDVRNYACGRTPVCNECERLVNSGVVVVAAAGNRGYHHFETAEGGSYEGYTAFSITDPGNADGVITVGATHRYWPHTYGVSFFSSRGPTGDGRMKPDLVAPGERIRAPLPSQGNTEWGDLDGTSMAAPHVSGAAAMLMARYSEMVGEPRRIKQILCSSATDLGRERSFQGNGMLDVLRAFQSI